MQMCRRRRLYDLRVVSVAARRRAKKALKEWIGAGFPQRTLDEQVCVRRISGAEIKIRL